MPEFKRSISLIVVVLLLSSCANRAVCDRPQPYIHSKAGAELVIPEGLDEPGTDNRLIIPEISKDLPERSNPCTSGPPVLVIKDSAVAAPPPAPDRPPSTVTSSVPLEIGPGFKSESVEETISAWADSWARADVPTYLGFYSRDMRMQDGEIDREQWLRTRSDLLVQTGIANIAVRNVQVEELAADRRKVRFIQEFDIPTGTQAVVKEMEMVWEDEGWRILSERVDQIMD